MPHPFVHIEIGTRDIDRARRFYEAAFGWTVRYQAMEGTEAPYGLVDTGQAPSGGIFQAGAEQPLGVTIYIGSDDLQESLSKIEAAGGRTLMPPTEVTGEGWFALFADPDGNTLGLWKGANPG